MRDALMAASYAISLMLPLRLLLKLFLTKPKTHSGWYDSRWYGDVFVQSTPKPAPNFKSSCSCICILFSLTHPPMIFSAIRRYGVTWDFTNFPTPNPNWYDRSIRCMLARDGIKMAFFGPTSQRGKSPYNGRLSSWIGHDAEAQALLVLVLTNLRSYQSPGSARN